MAVGAWLLDLDGTLVESIPVLYQVYGEFLRSRGATPTLAEFHRLDGWVFDEFVPELHRVHHLAGSLTSLKHAYRLALIEAYRSRVQPRPGASALLDRLGGKTALVTSGPTWLVHVFLGAVGWTFDTVVCGDEVARGKPSPDPYLLAMARLKTFASECICLEDSPHGAEAAAAAGAWVVALTDRRPREAFPAAHRSIAAVGDLLGAVPTTPWWVRRGSVSLETKGSGELLALEQIRHDVIRGRFSAYSDYVAGRITPIGVSGVLCCEDQVLLARRSEHVHGWPGAWELAPSGTLDGPAPEGVLLRELREEVGVIGRVTRPLGLAFDPVDRVYDLAYELSTDDSEAAVEGAKRGGEYVDARWLRRDQAQVFLDEQIAVPTSRLLVQALLDP